MSKYDPNIRCHRCHKEMIKYVHTRNGVSKYECPACKWDWYRELTVEEKRQEWEREGYLWGKDSYHEN